MKNSKKPHWTQTKERYKCPTCGMPTTHHMRIDLPKMRRLIDAHNGRDGLLCPRSGSFIDLVLAAKYVQVRCKACGWEDGLREDIVAKGELSMYCDSCSDVRPVEIIATGGPGRTEL